MMTSFDPNALRQGIVFRIFVENRSCVTNLPNKYCSEVHSGSCSQMTSSCKCPDRPRVERATELFHTPC